MARILAIDYGEKSVGLAVSDELQLSARPLRTLRRRRGGYEEMLDEIARICDEMGVGTVIVGLPLNMDGTRGAAANRALRFISDLGRRAALPILPVDERLSSREADSILREEGYDPERRRQLSDETAALVILRDYLSAQQR